MLQRKSRSTDLRLYAAKINYGWRIVLPHLVNVAPVALPYGTQHFKPPDLDSKRDLIDALSISSSLVSSKFPGSYRCPRC